MRSQKRVKRTSKCCCPRRKAHKRAAFIKERLDRRNWIASTMTAESSKIVVHLAAIVTPKNDDYDKPQREKKVKPPKPKVEPQPTTSQKADEKKLKKLAKIEKRQLESQLEKKEPKKVSATPVPVEPVIEQLAQTSKQPQKGAKTKGKNKDKTEQKQQPNVPTLSINEEASKKLNEELRVDVEQTSNLHNGVHMKSSVDSGVDVHLDNDFSSSKSPDKNSSNESIAEVPEIEDGVPKTPTSSPAEYQDQIQREPSREADFAINVPKTPTTTPAEFQDPYVQQHQMDFSKIDSLKLVQERDETEEAQKKIELKQEEKAKPTEEVVNEDGVELAQEALPDEEEVEVKKEKAGKNKKGKKEKQQQKTQEVVEAKPVEEELVSVVQEPLTEEPRKNKKDKKNCREIEPQQLQEEETKVAALKLTELAEPFVKEDRYIGETQTENKTNNDDYKQEGDNIEETLEKLSHVLGTDHEQINSVGEKEEVSVDQPAKGKKDKRNKKNRKSESETIQVEAQKEPVDIYIKVEQEKVSKPTSEESETHQSKKEKKSKKPQRRSESETVGVEEEIQEAPKLTEEPAIPPFESDNPNVQEKHEDESSHHKRGKKNKKNKKHESNHFPMDDEVQEEIHTEERPSDQDINGWAEVQTTKKNKKSKKPESEDVQQLEQVAQQHEAPSSPIEGQTPEETAKIEAAAPQSAEQPTTEANRHDEDPFINGFHDDRHKESTAEDLEVAQLVHNETDEGRTKFAQNVAHFVDHVQKMLHDDIHSSIMTSTVHSASSKPVLYKIDPILPLHLPDRRVDSPRVRYRRLLAKDVHFLARMLEKYGEDYDNMTKDPENFIHDTASGLKRKMGIFKKSPQFDDYLRAKAEGRPIESIE